MPTSASQLWMRRWPASASRRSSIRIKGGQFISFSFTSVQRGAEVRINIDGRERWIDSVFIERLWRSMKYECAYLHACETGSELRAGPVTCNTQHPHSCFN